MKAAIWLRPSENTSGIESLRVWLSRHMAHFGWKGSWRRIEVGEDGSEMIGAFLSLALHQTVNSL